MSQHSGMINLDVPDDFPLAPLEQFHGAVLAHHASENERWGHWARACTALHYRFLACAEADEVFRSSLSAAGTSPPPPERTRQEIALFAFFSSGLSAIECLGYGLYFVASIVDPAGFARPPDKIWFRDVADAYQERFESDSIAGELVRVNRSTELESWRCARNILMHREAPARHHFAGIADVIRFGSSTEPAESETAQGSDWLNESLSAATTSQRRAWLATTLSAILQRANEFASARL